MKKMISSIWYGNDIAIYYEILYDYMRMHFTVAFLLSWSPYAALALYVIITKNNSIHPVLSMVPVVLAKSSSLWNPYIYFMRDTKFNDECPKMVPVLKCFPCWKAHPAQEKESINLCDSGSSPVTCRSLSSVWHR